jgi:hypothetical protein
MIGDGDCGEIGGMKNGRGNRSTWRKPAPRPLWLIDFASPCGNFTRNQSPIIGITGVSVSFFIIVKRNGANSLRITN